MSQQAKLKGFALVIDRPSIIEDYYRFVGVPPSLAKDLLTGWPNVEPCYKQNDSPTMRAMVLLAERHKGTLEGYVIPVETGRWDARIVFDGFTITATKEEAERLAWKLKPDEFDEISPGKWRFWWD